MKVNTTTNFTMERDYTSAELRRMIDQELARRDHYNKGGVTVMGAPSVVFGKSEYELEKMYKEVLRSELTKPDPKPVVFRPPNMFSQGLKRDREETTDFQTFGLQKFYPTNHVGMFSRDTELPKAVSDCFFLRVCSRYSMTGFSPMDDIRTVFAFTHNYRHELSSTNINQNYKTFWLGDVLGLLQPEVIPKLGQVELYVQFADGDQEYMPIDNNFDIGSVTSESVFFTGIPDNENKRVVAYFHIEFLDADKKRRSNNHPYVKPAKKYDINI